MLKDFKAFIARGNVLDLAVAVIIGAAFGTIVTSLTEDLVMPIISALTGKPDYSSFFIRLGAIPADFTGDPNSYAALKEAGVAMLGYGAFITALLNFLIIAFAVFLIARYANRLFKGLEAEAPPPAAPSEEVLLLREIRDSLKK
ncbi:large conductance mechanosensitive channel protein MscL [Sandaracinobacteroides sp. A072]|uniref:large conductance mechanosensitive channel protein MscL n=1 Tax=Sandaracinobacteroides sp. A072 TaxID=3461146 RepID=UPI00404163BD